MSSFLLGYIDPGSGSYVFQAAIAGLTTVLFFFSNIKRRILGLFKKQNEASPVPLASSREATGAKEKTLAG